MRSLYTNFLSQLGQARNLLIENKTTRAVGSSFCLCLELFLRVIENGVLSARDCIHMLQSTQ